MARLPQTMAKWHMAKEAEANIFAMALLMPEVMVHKEMRQRSEITKFDDGSEWIGFNEIIVKEMAELFQVEISLMTLRLKQLGYFKSFPT